MLPPALPSRYLPLRHIGEGATGHVWEAQDSRLNQSVAVKIVRPNLAKYARFRARFAREVALSARLVHPRVVPVYDYGQLDNGSPYVVMGLANQGSLEQLLRWGPPLHEVLRMVDQVLDALAEMHAQGLVHQDLKPENILLHSNAQGEVDAWVADLGVAGTFSELAMAKRGVAGTPKWMAPEQLSRRPQELGPWTDLYALGRMLFEILGGEPTPSRLGPKQLLEMRLQTPEAPPNVPDAIGHIILRLLHPDPRQRYDRAADVRRALRDAATRIDDTRTAQGGGNPGSTTFTATMTMAVDGQETVEMSTPSNPQPDQIPRWNRVPPDSIPSVFPAPYRETPHKSSLSLFAMQPSPLIGREEPQQLLWRMANEVIQQQSPRVVLITGPAGTDKLRLAESVMAALDAGGFMETIPLRYHSPPSPQDGYQGAVREILAPWHDTRKQMVVRLQRWLARDQQVTVDSTQREAEVLTRWCGYPLPGESPINAAAGLAFLYRHIEARSWRGGTALLLENAHLARAAGDGLAICEALLDHSVGQRPVLAMVTLDSDAIDKDHQLQQKIAALESRGAIRLAIQRMSQRELQQNLTESLSAEPNFAQLVAGACQGSLANATLLIQDLASKGLLRQGSDQRLSIRPESNPADAFPDSLRDLFERRVENVLQQAANPAAAEEALAAAVLVGHEPPVSLIRTINAEGVDSLVAAGILRQRGWLLRFEHDGVAQAARRRAQGRPDLAKLHDRLAKSWATLGEATGGDVETYKGAHWLHANQPTKALPPLLRAARTAIEEGRSNTALDAAKLAIIAADHTGTKMGQVEARHQAADALLNLDRPVEALSMIRQAEALGKIDRRSEARLHVLTARAMIAQGKLEDSRKRLESAANTFVAVRDRKGLIDTLHGQGTLYRIAGQPRSAAKCFRQMLQLNTGDPRVEVQGIIGLVESRLSAGKLRDLDRLLKRLRRTARQSGDTRNIARSTYTAGLVHLNCQELPEAERHFLTARALTATLGADRLHLACLNSLGEVYRIQGNHLPAEQCYQRSVLFAKERQWSTMAAVAQINLAQLYMTTGASRRARAHLDQAATLLADHPHHYAWQVVGLFRAIWAAEALDQRRCRSWWRVALERGLQRMRNPDLLPPLRRLQAQVRAQGWTDIVNQVNQVIDGILPKTEAADEE